jgi:hypothetical protein
MGSVLVKIERLKRRHFGVLEVSSAIAQQLATCQKHPIALLQYFRLAEHPIPCAPLRKLLKQISRHPHGEQEG